MIPIGYKKALAVARAFDIHQDAVRIAYGTSA